ncbi:SDR family NAD(P)-dependent oxidoreductase [Candidatus Poribacteria bacterium]|nr:SDR family NAD(P)-dependent oxidoreductase [Candidatus Poribacteria bacterium]
MKLQGKVALITGAGSGIGAATARRMAAEGASIAVTGIPAEGVQAVASELEAAGHSALAIPTDVSDARQVEVAVARTVDRLGRLDILVPNAGIQLHDRDVNLHELPEEVWGRGGEGARGFLTTRPPNTHFHLPSPLITRFISDNV